MKSRTKATSVCLVAALALGVAGGAQPATAGSERMQLECLSGDLAGHTLERTNGSSWWDVEDGTVYTTKSLTITSGDDVVYERDYGKRSRVAVTCTGDHFDWTWNLEVVEAGS